MKKIQITLATLTLLTVALLLPTYSFAKRGSDDRPMMRQGLTNKPTRTENEGEKGMMRSCEARKEAVKTRMNRLVDLVTNMESRFDKHADRVKNFYTTKVVPAGKTVSNYDALLADIQTKKNAVQTALNKAKTDVGNFDCSSEKPFESFKEDMQAVKKALHTYRTSIKNLIVAVAQVSGDIKDDNLSPTP